MHDDHTTGPVGRPDDEPDIDAEFAAMMEGLDLSADPTESHSEDSAPPEATGPVSADDVPHNVYGVPGGAGSGDAGGAKAIKIAIVLTPLASAEALAALCAASGLDCTVVPSRSGAIAVKEFVSAHAEWDIAELLGGTETEPAEAAELAAALSRLSRPGVVLITADLATDVGIETGLSGTITARRYQGGQAGEEVSPGVLLPDLDEDIEDILLGATRVQDIAGAIRTDEVKPGRMMRWLGRGMRRRDRGDGDGGRGDDPSEG
ncbi:hypothetical protein CWT12_07605 [Actinomyces sp. 432]|uniref:hypothetical protein n=1 Tax=unclassified Actinomyces TaxID=2609248 RepID=UPI0013739F36|nr:MULTISPECIES: hypothetical protein [unclassified Actinomyces]MBW3067929.1 hypothetical protein [Actinomyces sp. 594]QHO91211.1 hypothetical protein CWT12_07605 [Actinomyces sp. 432]